MRNVDNGTFYKIPNYGQWFWNFTVLTYKHHAVIFKKCIMHMFMFTPNQVVANISLLQYMCQLYITHGPKVNAIIWANYLFISEVIQKRNSLLFWRYGEMYEVMIWLRFAMWHVPVTYHMLHKSQCYQGVCFGFYVYEQTALLSVNRHNCNWITQYSIH